VRILLVTHRYPPAHSAGTEVYTAELARRLAARGEDVRVFTAEKDVALPDLGLRERRHEGIPVRELVNNLFLTDFRQTWERPEIERLFGQVLEELRPDVVHFQHLMYLSVGCLREAARRGCAVVFTLHDFWLQCARFGQLVHGDGSICHVVDFERCGTCMGTFKWRQTELQRRAGKTLARIRSATGIDLATAGRTLAGLVPRRASEPLHMPHPAAGEDPGAAASDWRRVYAEATRERSAALRAAALEHVDRFVSPSRFLRQRLVEWGLPAERVEYAPTGIDARAFALPRESDPDRVRIAFIGSLVAIKGAHVLVEAFGALDEARRARAELVLYGPSQHEPEYVERLQSEAARVGARLGGALSRDEVPRALARADLLVIPSLWYENRPLIVLEALAARTPLLVSDLGGLAELVEDGKVGWRFPVGDAARLAERLRAIVDDRRVLDALYADDPELPDWEGLVDSTVRLYREIRAAKRG